MEFWDDYIHHDPNLTYISESIRTPDVENLISYEFLGCNCITDCLPNKCICVQRSGASYTFPNKLDLANYILNINIPNKPIYECNNNCTCVNQICGNKLVQYGPRKNLSIIDMDKKGAGLITKNEIRKGNFICEYAGEVLTQNEAQARFKIYKMGLSHNYIFCINESFGEKREKTYIDPTFYGNIGRYINHSCEPNSILIPVRIHNIIPKLCIYANKTILKNSEITFDYGNTNTMNYVFGHHIDKKECLCSSSNCRKFLPFDETV